MTRQVTLAVNDNPIPIDYFVQAFIDHTVAGMIEALEGTGPIKKLNLAIDGDKVAIDLNGKPVPTNAFASQMVRSTLSGMVLPLKGVKDTTKIRVNVARGT
ncbi:MAG: hypothetical protein HYX87_05930 [Chloroflexi bacterium]|nr:hypothetical protein [Chloroflexota bacterium]